MIGIDTPIPVAWIAAAALAAIAILAWISLQLRPVLRPAYLWTLAGLRAAACGLLVLLLLNPYRLDEQPDADGFRVAVLLDVSGSMDTADIERGQRTRFSVVEEWLTEEKSGSLINALREMGYRLDISLFAQESMPYTGGQVLPLPGTTGIGSALGEMAGHPDLGAIILASDGQSNTGLSPIEAAQRIRSNGVPISTIGIGSRAPPGEVKAGFSRPRFEGEKGEPMKIDVTVSNSRREDQMVTLSLYDGDRMLESKEVQINAESEESVSFSVTPFQTGGKAYRLVARAPDSPEQVDVAAVEVREPDRFRLLYLAAQPSLEFRFLQQAAREAEQISLEAIIRTGPESFFHQLGAEQEGEVPIASFPREAEFFHVYDAILLDTHALGELEEATVVLRDFVANRGGGLLLMGDVASLPETLATLSPVVAVEEVRPGTPRPLAVAPAPIFTEVTGGALFNRPSVFVPEELPAWIATEWKRGARPILRSTEAGDRALLAVQAYGAGRVAWLGTNATWRWRMSSAIGADQHRLFWNNLMAWLASTGKPRLAVPIEGSRVALAEETSAEIDVMGSDFRPSQDATVSAVVTTPSGENEEFMLHPSFRRPGRYESNFRPDEAGEYRIRYEVAFPNGEELTRESFFIASHNDREREETAYREDLLRDLARITGGEFRHYTDVANFEAIPLREGIPTRENRRYFAGNPLFLLLLALPLFGEWYLRRKVGLK